MRWNLVGKASLRGHHRQTQAQAEGTVRQQLPPCRTAVSHHRSALQSLHQVEDKLTGRRGMDITNLWGTEWAFPQ